MRRIQIVRTALARFADKTDQLANVQHDKELWVHIFIVAVKLIATVVDAEFADNISKIVITLFTNFLNRTMSFFKKTEVQNLIWRYSNSCGVIVETNKKMVKPLPCEDPICRGCKCPVCYKPKTECNNASHKDGWFI